MMVKLPDIPVMFVLSHSGIAGAPQAFDTLESGLKSLRGRKFYGIFEAHLGIYRACVALTEVDDPKRLGFEQWVIPGGKYCKRKLLDWEDHVSEIGRIFDEMIAENKGKVDASRPSIEFYRSQKELILYLPHL